MWARNSTGNENILGYLTDAVPAAARPAARALFRTLLKRESRTLDRRELFWTHRTLASSLRSMEETGRLRERTTRRVFCMPVSVPVPAEPARALHQRPATAIFTGGLTYQPNLDALRAYAKDVLPAFEHQGVAPPVLKVIGAAPNALRTGLDHPSIRFLGYVPDVNEELGQAQVFFAPIVSGTGIKTKVLEAMAGGLPLIALPAGLTGLAGTAGRHYLCASDAADFVVQYQRIDRGSRLRRGARSGGPAACDRQLQHRGGHTHSWGGACHDGC
jgi:glycosyltransferase involved in cell wall biosynthesis